jgi:hypothetical protein
MMTTSQFDFSFVTYSGLPDLDPDDRLALAALERRGFRSQAVVWDDPQVDWSAAGICLVRSTWDYHLRRGQFLQWAQKVSAVTPLVNELTLIEWNSHKGYLRDLAGRGLPVIPTVWLKAGAPADLGSIMRDNAWAEVVVKPAVGLATFGLRRVANTAGELQAGQAHLEMLLRTGDAMIQPYYSSVISYGERALVFINNQYSHCVRKCAFQSLATAGAAGEVPAVALAEEIDIAYGIIATLERPALYARVDLVRDHLGCPRLLELELVEPSLFLSMHSPAAECLAEALCGIGQTVAVG